jgi:hypothetical protein
MKKFFTNLLSDVDNQVSSKRFITVGAFLLIVLAFLLDLALNITIAQGLLDIIQSIIWAGLGATTIEKFSRENYPSSNTNLDS